MTRTLSTSCAGLLLGLSVAGCSEPAVEPVAPVNLTAPESFQRDGVTWTRTPVTSDDEKLLIRFFEQNAALTGSGDMEGDPQMFASGSDRVFYWLRPAADGVRWTCIRFTNGQFTHVEGTGNPY